MLSIRETVRQLQSPALWLLTERLELYAVGSTPNAELMHELRSCDGMIAVRGIGDCSGAGIVGKAIRECSEAAIGIHEEHLFVFKSLS